MPCTPSSAPAASSSGQSRVRRSGIPSLAIEPGESVTFDEILLGSSGDAVQVGAPLVSGAAVTAEVVRHGRGEKIIIFKHKRRKNYRRKQGHRQGFTEVRINDIRLA